jgi:uncharacterized protein YndB with AHSA1/START domain
MSNADAQTQTVVMEREYPYPPQMLWRALTQPHLIEEWLMKNDFQAVVGRGFNLSAAWGSVACKVLEVEPERVLSYTWTSTGLDSVITWTLAPTDLGTRLRVEQVGFRPDQQLAYRGATAGWPRFFDALGQLLGRAG